LLLAVMTNVAASQAWLPSSYDPSWAGVPAERTISFAYDSLETPVQNGARLAVAVAALVPGDELRIGPGTYSMQSRFEVLLQGTAASPIRIVGEDPDDRPVITRPDASQNIINVGRVSGGQSRYLVFQDIECAGGADLIRLYDCQNVWIDRCYLHDGMGVGIAANSNDVSFLYITRNDVARPGTSNPVFTGEGMYLGANDGVWKMSYSVVALNTVRETQVSNPGSSYQGDGIEVKHGSHHNWIAENTVHTTQFPCMLVGGTGDANGPDGENVVERNTLYDSRNNVLQVQVDAIVRNNIAVYSQGPGGAAFQSTAQQGPVRNFRLTHNTFINTGRAANLHWNAALGMVCANNVCYSQTSQSMNFVGGSSGVVIAGNVVVGQVPGASSGFVSGFGMTDFVNATWTATKLDVTPKTGRFVDNRGAWNHLEPVDRFGRPRAYPADPGAVENGLTTFADTYAISAADGGTQTLSFDAGPFHAGKRYLVVGTITDVAPALRVGTYDVPLVLDAWTQVTFAPNTGPLFNTIGDLDAQGRASTAALTLPRVLGVSLFFWHVFTVFDASNNLKFVGNPVPLLYQ